MNSFYGVLGSSGCRFFDPRLASSITLRGQSIMLETRRLIEAAGFQVIYGDTDSTFVWLDREVTPEQAESIGRQLARQVTEHWQHHLQQEWGQEPQCVLTMPLLVGLDGVEKMSKSKNNYIGITEDANTMFAKVLSISDELMWDWYTLLSFGSLAEIASLRQEVAEGRNPKDAKVMLAKEITARFHSAAAADAAEEDFNNRARGGIPDDIPELQLCGAPLGIAALLKQAGLAPSTSEANRLIDGGGVRVDGGVVSDKGLKLAAGRYVVQVGKRKFARVTLA